MKAYITRDGLQGRLEFELPVPRPLVGEVLRWTSPVTTAGGHEFQVGDTIELIEITLDSPHGYHCSSGNWRARTKYNTSVWTTIEQALSSGLLERVTPAQTIWERLND